LVHKQKKKIKGKGIHKLKKVELGDTIIATWDSHKKVGGDLPTSNKWDGVHFGAMSALTDPDMSENIQESFLSGRPFEAYTACEDFISIESGGKTTATYYVTKDALEEYEATLDTYDEFVRHLKKLGAKIKIIKK